MEIKVLLDGKPLSDIDRELRKLRLGIEMANKALDGLGAPTQTEVHGEKRYLLLQGRIRALGDMNGVPVLAKIKRYLNEAHVTKVATVGMVGAELSEAGRVEEVLHEVVAAHSAMDGNYAPRFIAPSDTPLTLPERVQELVKLCEQRQAIIERQAAELAVARPTIIMAIQALQNSGTGGYVTEALKEARNVMRAAQNTGKTPARPLDTAPRTHGKQVAPTQETKPSPLRIKVDLERTLNSGTMVRVFGPGVTEEHEALYYEKVSDATICVGQHDRTNVGRRLKPNRSARSNLIPRIPRPKSVPSLYHPVRSHSANALLSKRTWRNRRTVRALWKA